MRNTISKFAFVAALGLALTFTFSCSSSGGNDDDPSPSPPKANMYFQSSLGLSNSGICDYLDEVLASSGGSVQDDDALEARELTFDMVRKDYLDIKSLLGNGVSAIENSNHIPESELRQQLSVSAGLTPTQLDAFMRGLNNRGNNSYIGFPADGYKMYCYIYVYIEKE
jgi:hypothetical protein